MITLHQLQAFLSVAKRGAVHAAAAELFVTQPAVSASVAALEKDLGVALLAREGRGVRLTPSGEALVRYAGQSLALLEQGRDAAVAAAHPGRGRLRIAAVTTAGEFVVPPLLKVFQTRFPDVEVFLEVGNRALVLERLGSREADLGIGGRPPKSSGLQGRAFLNNDLVIVASPTHALARRRSFDPALLDDVWLMREPGSGTRATSEEYLAEHGLEPRRVLNLGSNGAVKQAAAVGMGITLISAQAVSLELATGTLARLRARGTPIRRKWFCQYPSAGFLPAPALAFLEFASTAASRAAVQDAMKTLAPHA